MLTTDLLSPEPVAAKAAPTWQQEWDSLLADVRARSAEFTRQRHISQDIVERFKRVGIYRALVPRRFGGDERSPRQFCELIERLSQADGSAGWVASFGMGVTYLASLPEQTFAQIYKDSPDVVFAGGIFPPQPAPMVPGGFEVSGRWSFASGCMGATVVGVGISPVGDATQPLPRMAVMSPSRIRIDPTWEVIGLTGTGSHDIVADKVVVPEEWTFVRGSPSRLPEPIFRYPGLSLATQVLAVVGLGLGRGAIQEVLDMSAGRVSVTGAPKISDRPVVQMEVAKAEAQLRAARGFFYDAMDDAWETLLRGDKPSPEQVNMLRLSSTHAVRTGADVVRSMQMLVGMTGIYEKSPLSTMSRDSLVVTQHAFMGDITYQNAGAMLFGQKPLPGYL